MVKGSSVSVLAINVQGNRMKSGSKKKQYPKVVGVAFNDTDYAILTWLGEFLSMNKSDAIRTALRAYAAQMANLEREMKKNG